MCSLRSEIHSSDQRRQRRRRLSIEMVRTRSMMCSLKSGIPDDLVPGARIAKDSSDQRRRRLSIEMVRRTSSMMCSLKSEIPNDLIPEILVYLPVKSLLKFQCVSKQWRSMITSPKFIKSHISTYSSSEAAHQLLFNTFHGGFMRQCSLYSAFLYPSATQVSNVVDYPCNDPNAYFEIVGILNGLVCLAIGVGENQLCTIWNPALRKSKHLPRRTIYSYKRSDRVIHGFGYDESSDDYKVIKMHCVYRPDNSYSTTEVEIYSLRADTWRIFVVDLKGVVPYHNGSYANGKILWIANTNIISASVYKCKIIGLDMKSDKYEEVDGPVNAASNVYNSGITVLDGRLYVPCYHNGVKTDLWVMDKFGVEESWSKVFSIPYDDVSVPLVIKPTYGIKKVLCITRNGQVFLQDGQHDGVLLVYSLKDREFRRIQLANLYSFNQVFVYAERLDYPDGLCSTP